MKFLNRLNISISELMMLVLANDDIVRERLDQAIAGLYIATQDPSLLEGLAKLIQDNPDLMQNLKQKVEQGERVRKNHSIGTLVEIIIKKILEGKGFNVDRTGIGSDYEIDYDFIEDDQEQVLNIENSKGKYLVEIKATRTNAVHMSLAQAREAKKNPYRFFLCVVSLNDEEVEEIDVRENLRFILGVGEKVQTLVENIDTLQSMELEAQEEEGDVRLEIQKGQVKFKISQPLWENGKTLDELIETIQASQLPT